MMPPIVEYFLDATKTMPKREWSPRPFAHQQNLRGAGAKAQRTELEPSTRKMPSFEERREALQKFGHLMKS
jgi:hypothetical protein